MALAAVLFDISNLMSNLLIFITPLWIALLFGVLIGWSCRPPQWSTAASTSTSTTPTTKNHNHSPTPTPTSSIPNFNFPTSISSWRIPLTKLSSSPSPSPSPPPHPSLSKLDGDDSNSVEESELEHLCQLVEEKDGGPSWIPIMDRSTPNMTYQASRRDPQVLYYHYTGLSLSLSSLATHFYGSSYRLAPPQYRSTTVYEDVPPELMRDFFWDDEFRLKWDDMLIHAQTLEDSPTTGTMVVKWVRKFPFFCSDREYVIGRRIWESGQSYYCVTKGVQYPSVPRHNKPRRVDLYYSSWCIRAVESRKGDGQLTSCEVILFHHEDMGIPWEIAKLGVRQGMWGAVTKIDRGLRSYQRYRASGPPLSHCASMAQITTKVSSEYLRCLESPRSESVETGAPTDSGDVKKPAGRRNIPKVIVVGGAIALACTLDRGLLTKAVIFGVARRFAKIGRRL